MQNSASKQYFSKVLVFFMGIIFFTAGNIMHAASTDQNCEVLSGYKKFTCQSENHCKKYKPIQISFKTTPYKEEKEDPYEKAKEIYRDNQNGIYACSIIKIQQNSLNLVKEKLLKIEKSGSLAASIKKKIELRLNKIKHLSKAKKCKITDKQTIYSKKDLLTESTYELCKYSFHLEYMKDYHQNLDKLLKINKGEVNDKVYNISYVASQQSKIQNQISLEKQHSYKIFHLAFQSYVDYESNLPVHIFLELIKQDFIVYRQKLYQVLSPINQVVYKISNAMSY